MHNSGSQSVGATIRVTSHKGDPECPGAFASGRLHSTRRDGTMPAIRRNKMRIFICSVAVVCLFAFGSPASVRGQGIGYAPQASPANMVQNHQMQSGQEGAKR